MKKLESIKGSKFELTESEMNYVNGGEYSWCYFTTQTAQESKMDAKAWDVCIPTE